MAKGLGLDPEVLRECLRNDTVTSLCEKDEDKDAGRFRLTFFSAARRLRLIVDAGGAILKTTAGDHRRKTTGAGG